MTVLRSPFLVFLAAALAACAGSAHPRTAPRPAPAAAPPAQSVAAQPADAIATHKQPLVPPAVALMAGLMPLRGTGVDQFRMNHPTYDGRGVLIAILDTGIDPGVDGLVLTSDGKPKILDLRDFSGEGTVALRPITPTGDSVNVAGRVLTGAGRIGRLVAAGATWYGGVLRELPLGKAPAADLNGDGNNTDEFPVIVVKATDGWVVFLDSNLNGSYEDEQPLHDYRQGRETIALGTKPVTLAANFEDLDGTPSLDFFFDTGAHGTHVAGIAAGRNLFNVQGFDGVAPGAQLIGLKIANAARGGVSVNGSMLRAMEYAARFARARNLPLLLNMSFGVGNEHEGRATIDSIVNAFLLAHPASVFAISAGNDGPGLSTMGVPGSADLAFAVGATYPGAFARPAQPGVAPAADVLGWWSARGGELAKPDIVAPGVAFSSVPRWNTGDEVKGGTSMAAPHAIGLVACLLSAMLQENRPVVGADLEQALRASAAPFRGATVLDDGAGVPRLEDAYRWLVAEHQGSRYVVRAPEGGSAVFRRDGLAGPGDTLHVFGVAHAGGLRAAQFVLHANAPWIDAPDTVLADARVTQIPVSWKLDSLKTPGVHVATVRAWNPTDSLAGPLFSLVSTVVVPFDLSAAPLTDSHRTIAPAQVQRYFLRVPATGSTLEAAVSLPDSSAQHVTAQLFEPNGQPFRETAERELGGEDGGTVRYTVRAEDAVPGVYELDVYAPPLAAATVDVRAAVAAVTLAPVAAGLEVGDPGHSTETVAVTSRALGAGRDIAVAGRGLPPESVTVRVPAWAERMVVDVQVAPEFWDELTDDAVTVFDSAGQQLNNAPLNYAIGRQDFKLPDGLSGRPVTIELFPAFARMDAAHPWQAQVRVRFLAAQPAPIGGNQSLTVVPGGRSVASTPQTQSFAPPAGFTPFVEITARAASGGIAAVRRALVTAGK
ncbi:MAG TPA: S8 family serine peptidase [Gemmatimonadales bacterium]